MTLNQDGMQKQSKQCNKIEGVVPNSLLIFCLFVCLFVCLLAFCLTAGQGFKPNIGQAPPSLYPESRTRTSLGEIQSSLGTPLPSYK